MGYSIVNILGGLLIVTSTMVVVSKNIKHAIRWYAVQSLDVYKRQRSSCAPSARSATTAAAR